MLSILYSEVKKYGCPNCGCDSMAGGNNSYYGITTCRCRHCKLYFEIRPEDSVVVNKPQYSVRKKDISNPQSSDYIMEEAIEISHPRIGKDKWHWEPEDIKPVEGEYWNSRGIGYDLSGFVKTKKAGERLLKMVQDILGTTECKTYLDYRESEPNWIQFKFKKEEFDLEKLETLANKNNDKENGILTYDIIKSCVII